MMKYSSVFIVLIFYFISGASAQCPQGPLTLTSDEEIISFAKEYPFCTELDSSLFIGPAIDKNTSRISSIASLENITKVNGDLIIKANPWLESLEGINNIYYIKGNLEIGENKGLKTGLINSQLLKIDGDMIMISNTRMTGPFCTFPSLIKIGGSLQIYSFKPEKVQFPLLWKVGGDVRLSSDSGKYAENEFPELEIVEGDLTIYFDYIQADFIGLNSLKKVGSLFMHNPSRFKVYFGRIEECGSMNIRFDTPSDFYAFSEIEKLEYLNITSPSKRLISSFKQLTEVKNLSITTQKNKDTISIDFPSLSKVESMSFNGPMNTTLYEKIDTIDKVHYNNFNEVNQKDISNHKNVINELSISNSSIKEIESFGNNIEEIKISYLKEAIELRGSAFNENIIRKLWIESCPRLIDISGIDMMNCQDCQIMIRNNKLLEICTIDLICQSLIEKKNKIIISNNGKLCNNKEQVLEQCKALEKD